MNHASQVIVPKDLFHTDSGIGAGPRPFDDARCISVLFRKHGAMQKISASMLQLIRVVSGNNYVGQSGLDLEKGVRERYVSEKGLKKKSNIRTH